MTSAAIDDPLTPRETQAPCHVAYELSNHEIAESLTSALDGQRTRPEPASETRCEGPDAGSRVGGAVWGGVGRARYTTSTASTKAACGSGSARLRSRPSQSKPCRTLQAKGCLRGPGRRAERR